MLFDLNSNRLEAFDFDIEILQQGFAHYCVSISAYRDSKLFPNAELRRDSNTGVSKTNNTPSSGGYFW